MAAMRRPGTALTLAALAAPLAAVSVEGFFWSSTPSSADDHSSNDAGGLLESIFYGAYAPAPTDYNNTEESGWPSSWFSSYEDSDGSGWFEVSWGDNAAEAENDGVVEVDFGHHTSFTWSHRDDKKGHHRDGHHDRHDRHRDKKYHDWFSVPQWRNDYDYDYDYSWAGPFGGWMDWCDYDYSYFYDYDYSYSYPYSYAYSYSYWNWSSYDYDYDYGFLSDSLLGELFAEFNATLAELSSELYSLSGVAWDGADEHHESAEVIWDLEARLAAAEERIAELEREGAENLWWKEWLEQDATAIHAAAVEEGAVTHTMGTEYPFGVMGAGIPWVGVVADDPAADSAMPPMLSVDLASAMGIAQSYLNGAFSSCVQRGADGSVAGLFTTAIGAVANATGDGSFNLTGSRIANALGTIDIECTLFGLVGSSGDASHDVQAALDSMRAMTSSLPASHVPHPCKRPHGEAEEDDHPHPRGGEHDHMACLEEGEHVEALGGFGVHVGDGAIAAGSTVEMPTVLTHPTTGETFTIYVSVSAHDAADIHVGKPRGKPADRFPNDEGEPESVLREGETDRWNFAFIGMCLGGAALLVSLLVAATMLSRKRMVVRPAPAHVGMNARPRASGSSTTKARLPDSAVIVAMPGDLAAVDAAVVAEVVDVPPTSRA